MILYDLDVDKVMSYQLHLAVFQENMPCSAGDGVQKNRLKSANFKTQTSVWMIYQKTSAAYMTCTQLNLSQSLIANRSSQVGDCVSTAC